MPRQSVSFPRPYKPGHQKKQVHLHCLPHVIPRLDLQTTKKILLHLIIMGPSYMEEGTGCHWDLVIVAKTATTYSILFTKLVLGFNFECLGLFGL